MGPWLWYILDQPTLQYTTSKMFADYIYFDTKLAEKVNNDVDRKRKRKNWQIYSQAFISRV